MAKQPIYTYFSPVDAINQQSQREVIDLWRNSWSAKGWNPIILSEQHAKGHKLYNEFVKHIDKFPTVNPKQYERACWMRWLALDVVGGGTMSDYDVMNFTWEPLEPAWFAIHEPENVPCLVQASPQMAKSVIRHILAHGPKDYKTENGKPHTSDMFLFQQKFERQKLRTCVEYYHPGWECAPTIHFATFALNKTHRGISKANAIRELTEKVKTECSHLPQHRQ